MFTCSRLIISRMYCNNCGERGHVFKDCRHPIMSCGLILLDSTSLPCDPETMKILMVHRKHSMAFTEFVRGKYEVSDLIFIQKLMTNMTFEEHSIIKNSEFQNVWTFHWGVGRDHHSHEYETSKQKFITLDLSSLIIGGYSESEWGFPKGRRQHRESDLNCAIREFGEETEITRESYTICKNLILEESFKGTNGINYKHLYYIAISKETITPNSIMSREQEREICQVKWMSLKECSETTRPHYTERQQLIKQLESTVRMFHT